MATYPYLALKHAAGSEEPVFFSVSESKAIDIDNRGELKNDNCWATPQGWVLVRDTESSSTYLMDPHDRADKRRIPLPHLPEDNLSTYCSCLLSDYFDPAQRSSSCIVLLVEPDSPVLWYCHIGDDVDDDDKQWVRHEYDIGSQGLPDLGEGCSEEVLVCPIASCGGKFYLNGCLEEIGVLEFCPGPMFSLLNIHDAIDEDDGFEKIFMVESRQDLYMVSMLSSLDLDTVYRVTVHKMDFLRKEWHKVDDLGDRAFLLSSWYFGASCSAEKCGLEQGCVYSVNPWDKCVRVYNIKDGTTKVLDLKEAPMVDQALWMLPIVQQ
ncbi:unnamed protein product [Urochloa decumbens]|uniref:KIB1-4 beta-propeller domain-containing protein n=1 Tax=Urochloa decumbens TaxID=240449 RepID=A0ABC8YEC3_9POAL